MGRENGGRREIPFEDQTGRTQRISEAELRLDHAERLVGRLKFWVTVAVSIVVAVSTVTFGLVSWWNGFAKASVVAEHDRKILQLDDGQRAIGETVRSIDRKLDRLTEAVIEVARQPDPPPRRR